MSNNFTNGIVQLATNDAVNYANATVNGLVSKVSGQVGAALPDLQSLSTQSVFNLGGQAAGNLGGGIANAANNAFNNAWGGVQNVVNTAFTGGLDALGGGSNNLGSGLSLGGKSNSGAAGPTSSTSSQTDIRVKIRAQTSAVQQIYGPNTPNNILQPLHDLNGMLFPYTPTISWSQAVEYKSMSLTHSNQDYLSYSHTPSTALSLAGEFTVQNEFEGKYLLAVMHFLRVVSKMYFGKPVDGYKSGMPPPILLFSGYGNYMFNDLPVIVKDHTYTLNKDVDYIDISFGKDGIARLPAILTINVNLVVQNTPKKNREEFNLDKFRTGELMRGGKKGWI